jgi:exopolysaccharide biosynthesis WecB/TagA/CpsF family protein
VALSTLFGLLGAGAAAATAYLFLLTLAAFKRPAPRRRADPRARLACLIPAHDEAALISRSVESLLRQDYPRELFDVIVIADNCSDETAARAIACGARVVERCEPDRPGKGRALRWAMDALLLLPEPPDAVVVVDADSIAGPCLLRELEAALQSGHDAVQAEYLVLDENGSSGAELVSVGFLLFHRVRLGGRAALGLPSALVGNGMLLSRRLIEAHPWDAFIGAEDLEYTINLCLAGVRPVFAPGAAVVGPMPTGGRASRRQRMRWEGGRFHQMRTRLGPLWSAALARRDMALLSVAVDLTVPPLGILAMLIAVGGAATGALALTGLVSPWAALSWAVAGTMLAGYVLGGLVAAHAPASAYRSLLRAPLFLASKLLVYVRLAAGYDVREWQRSERPADAPAAGERVEIAGVEIDPVTREEAVDRIRGRMGSRQLFQIATVNLDFLVRAQVEPDVRAIFGRTGLNVADGAPVVWLSRLLGARVRVRVAGADLVPDLCEAAAATGVSVFLLGGEDGAATAAAETLVERFPTLRIAGCLEPPRKALDEMDLPSMARVINHSGADVLFVAFGHPKQERWIDLSRDLLDVSVAMGVGCAFDLLAGRRRRAPGWMQRAGLEWLFRVAQEPDRLLGRYLLDATWLLRLATVTLIRRLA